MDLASENPTRFEKYLRVSVMQMSSDCSEKIGKGECCVGFGFPWTFQLLGNSKLYATQ